MVASFRIDQRPPAEFNRPSHLVGHITEEEIRARIARTDAANGFANRFLFASVRRSKLLPHGDNLDDAEMQRPVELMKVAVAFAKHVGRVEMTGDARAQMGYPHLTAEQPGLLGAITARAEPQTIRLALVYGGPQHHLVLKPHRLRSLFRTRYAVSVVANKLISLKR